MQQKTGLSYVVGLVNCIRTILQISKKGNPVVDYSLNSDSKNRLAMCSFPSEQ